MNIGIKILSGICLTFILGACRTVTTGPGAPGTKGPEMALGWKLGAQAYTFKLFTFAEAIRKIDSCKLSYVEAYPGQVVGGGIEGKMLPDMEPDKRKAVLKMLKANHVKMTAFGVARAKEEQEWIKIFDFCKAMGVETITAEPDEKHMSLLSKLADQYAINVAIHNHPSPSHYWNPDVVLNAIKGQSKRIGACADIGHWVRSGLNPVECLKKLEGRVLHSHMKDLHQNGKGGHDVHWGEGISDIPAVIAELKRQKFSGGISAEYEYNWQSNSKDVAQSVVNFRKMFGAQ